MYVDKSRTGTEIRESPSSALNLGCPKSCEVFVCIDKFPYDKRVVKADVYEYLRSCKENGTKYESIYTKNLLEHLGNPLEFLQLCKKAF